jgi:hypothetical protein
LYRLEIPSSSEKIGCNSFLRWTSLKKSVFSSDNDLKEIDAFGHCASLSRPEISLSVEVANAFAFLKCISLEEIVLSTDRDFGKIHGSQ